MPTEADTCRKLVVPKLLAAGWDNEPHSIAEQRTITDGRVVPVGNPRSVFAGRRHHIVHMDGLSLGIDGSRVFASPVHISLVDDVDELERLNEFLDVVPQSDGRVPPSVVKRLMRCGPLKAL
jgi:hypothetical protein